MDDKTDLLYTEEAKGRIRAGLSWDEINPPKKGLLDKVLKKETEHHNLDITCYIYNNKREFVDFVGAEAREAIDETGKIYHSGDDTTGAGEGDDEYICAELLELPPSIHGIVFLIEVRSEHSFEEVSNISCRLADGMTDKNLFERTVTDDSVKSKNAWIFCSVYRDESSITGWKLNKVCEAPNLAEVKHWGNYLAQYVD